MADRSLFLENDVQRPFPEDAAALSMILDRHKGEIAAIIMEPVLCNTGAMTPKEGYLADVQQLCQDHGCLLIFDEVITGFRLAPGGAQEYLGVTPDLAVFGKAVAAGFPLSVLAGREEVMSLISRGEVAHSGTFNSNPIVMAAASAALHELLCDNGAAYDKLFATGRRLMDGIRAAAAETGVSLLVDGPGPMFNIYLTDQPAITDYRQYAACDLAGMARLHTLLLDEGVNIVGRGLLFLSTEHSDADVDQTVAAVRAALRVFAPESA
jgi:glutamate-1-semialdehyde 2,1-aminomutase